MTTLQRTPPVPVVVNVEAPMDREASLLRVFTCGSVDDGKSTLIGRLLHDSKSLHEDQIESISRASARRNAAALDLSLLTDGLKAEREQGITIDVAYRYFATAKRRFILADTPGHVQYTRNMATGASTADVAIILIDARQGVVEQTRRHACIAALLGVTRLIVCVNKMDLIDFDRPRFEAIKADFEAMIAAARPAGEETIAERVRTWFVPISALHGDNVVERSTRTPWFTGEPLLELLETIPDEQPADSGLSRFPVQYVLRPQSDEHHDYRGYAGRVASGSFRVGDEVLVLPGEHRSRITSIHIGRRNVDACSARQSAAIQLADDIDICRGEMIVHAAEARTDFAPKVTQQIDATIIWMDPRPLAQGRRLLLKHTTRDATAMVQGIVHRLNMGTLEVEKSPPSLAMNEIGRVRLRLASPLVCDPYSRCRETGSFILIDEGTNNTVGAGLIASATAERA